MTGLQIVGVFILGNGLIGATVLLASKTIDWKGFVAVAAAAIVGALVTSNFDTISTFGVTSGSNALNVQIRRVEARAQEVEAIAKEVQAARDSIQLLVSTANTTNQKISASEANIGKLTEQTESAAGAVKTIETSVTQMRNDVRQVLVSIFQSLGYSMGTRNLFPPPEFVGKEIDRHLNILATFAYPDARQREVEIGKLMADLKKAQPQPPGK